MQMPCRVRIRPMLTVGTFLFAQEELRNTLDRPQLTCTPTCGKRRPECRRSVRGWKAVKAGEATRSAAASGVWRPRLNSTSPQAGMWIPDCLEGFCRPVDRTGPAKAGECQLRLGCATQSCGTPGAGIRWSCVVASGIRRNGVDLWASEESDGHRLGQKVVHRSSTPLKKARYRRAQIQK